MISQPLVTSTTPHKVVAEKRGRVHESIGRERRAEESHVEDTRSGGGHPSSVTNHAFKGDRNKNDEEKELDEKEEKHNVAFIPEATKQAFASVGVTYQGIAAGDSTDHNTTIQSVAVQSPAGNDANVVAAKEDADKVTDRGREEKGEDGSDGDCMNTPDKCDSHGSGDSRVSPGGEDNKSMTGNDLQGGGAQGNVGEGRKVVLWTPPRINVTRFGLYVPMPPEFLRHFLNPLLPENHRGASPNSASDR